MLANLANSLIMHKRIETTLAKAKELRVYVEPLITKSKSDTTHSRRTVFTYLRNKYAVKELFSAVAEKIGQRPGGYTRILKTGFRHGDAAEMALIELVDFNETYSAASPKSAAKKTTRRGSKKSAAAPDAKAVAESPKAAEAAEAPKAAEAQSAAGEAPAAQEPAAPVEG
jgi:large subunit ribosomal protein L17